ncbi:ABC transporter permease, partial [Clostridioides difficile]|uniref:ABC transporter permease n=1 Tax=Clostridioides difficile TaxID=1496 RepID=UPI002350CE00
MRRSKIVWITVFASIMIAVIVFAGGQDVYNDSDLHYGLKSVYDGSRYIDHDGLYMDAVQPWSIFFFLPVVFSL